MGVIIDSICFLLGFLIGLLAKGEFTFNYKHTYRDDTTQFTEIKDPIGYNTNNKLEDVDTPAEIAAKIQEAIGVFMDEGPAERDK